MSANSLYRTLLKAKNALVDAVPHLILTVENNPSRITYKNAVAEFLHDCLYQSEIGQRLRRLQWLYSGLHVSTAMFGDFISLTCKPDERRADTNGDAYIQGTPDFTIFNFTRFLWPSQTVLRNRLTDPLEVIIENDKKLISKADASLIAERVEIVGSNHFSIGVDASAGLQERLWRRIIIPRQVKSELHSGSLKPTSTLSLANTHLVWSLKQAYLSLYCNYLENQPNTYDISPQECFEAIANTLRLHVIANLIHPSEGIEPRTVIFFPVIVGKTRFGVYCFVLGKYLDDDDRLLLHVLADAAISHIYLADQLIYYRKVEGTFRAALLSSPLLAHEGAHASHMAFNSVFAAIKELEASAPRPQEVLTLLRKANNEYEILDSNISQLKEALYAPSKEKSLTTLATIERELRKRIPEKDVEHIDFKIPDSLSQIEMPAADRLPSVIAELIKNGLTAVEETVPKTQSAWVTVEIELSPIVMPLAERSELIIRIQDCGSGMPPEVKAEYDSTLIPTSLPSKHAGGKGMLAAKFIEKICEGNVEYPSVVTGTLCIVTVPCVVKEILAQSSAPD
jgi:hypothetical protein